MPLYRQKGSSCWWISLHHPDHPRIRRSAQTDDRQEAQRIHDELKAELWKLPAIKGRTWGQAVVLWASQPGRSRSDVLSMAKFGTFFPDRPLTKVSGRALEAALSFCRTPGTYMRYRARLGAILALAKATGWLRELPMPPTRRVAQKQRIWLTRKEWARLYLELPEHQRPMAEFAIETGLRQANVLGLTWDRVDLERRLVWVEGEDMKAERAIAVPLSDRAVLVLSALQGVHPRHVFTYAGKPIREVKSGFIPACVRAKVGRYEQGRYTGFTWHGLRHTWASWHVQAGTPLDVLQKLGGWSDLRMVQNYAHHSADYLAGFANNTARKK